MNQRTQLSVTSPVLWGIIGALAVWGIYLAVGVTGYFSPDSGLFDYRKPIVVIACSAGFLAFWWGNLQIKKLPGNHYVDATGRANPCNWISLLAATIGYVLWGAAFQASNLMTTRLGYASAFLMGTAMLTGIIGISDPIRRKGRWAALLAILMALLSFVLFFVQVRLYFDRNRPL